MSKISLSVPAQIQRLTQRGLLDSRNELPRALLTHGYFRLSGYWRYLQQDPASGRNMFDPGSDFATVLDIYFLDAELRNLMLEGLAEVEIALRTSLTTHLCAAGGIGDEYLHPDTYLPRVSGSGDELRVSLLAAIKEDIDRSKERHIRHHRATGPVPLWVAAEALSFGTLSRMYGLLASEHVAERVATRLGYDQGLLSSASTNLRAIAVFRNVCAHHGRVWNRIVTSDKPRLFGGAFGGQSDFRKYHEAPWGVISVLAHLVENVRGNTSFMTSVNALLSRDAAFADGLKEPDRR